MLRPITPERSAIDQANEGLSWEPEAVRGRVKLALGEATSLDAQDASFDTVLLGEVLEHQVDPWPAVDEALRVLRPAGRLVITVPYGLLRYHDHKAPMMLVPLIEELRARGQVHAVELVGRYLGVVAAPAAQRSPRADAGLWRQAALIAEQRITDLDRELEEGRRAVAALSKEIGELRSARALREHLEQRIGELSTAVDEMRRRDEEQREAIVSGRERLACLEVELEHLRRELAVASTGSYSSS